MSLISNIQELCSRKNTTLVGLERAIGLGRGTIRNWDKSSPSIDKLLKVANYFDVSIDSLVENLDKDIISAIIKLSRINDDEESHFPEKTKKALSSEMNFLKKEYWDVPLETYSHSPQALIDLIKFIPLSDEFKHDFLFALNKVEEQVKSDYPPKQPLLSPKEERDIARDLEKILANMASDEALSFYDGEPMDEESKELLRISLESSMRQAKILAKKKFTPKKYRKEE